MAKYIPDGTNGYEPDMDNLIQAISRNNVVTGLVVSAQSSPNMTVQITSGSIRYAGVSVTVGTTASLTIAAADPTNARVDVVHVTNGGVTAVVTGTPAASPKPPALPATSILLAFVSVAAAAANIQNSNISNRNVPFSDGVVGGTDASKNAAGVAGRLYAATDTGTLYYDNGASVTPMNTPAYPNLVLNSDFGRRTVFGLAMPEVFADTSAWTGGVPTVAANVLTIGTAGANCKWSGPISMWRDGRWSASFKASTLGANGYSLVKYVDANDAYNAGNAVFAEWYNGNFVLVKTIAGVTTTVATVAQALTLNRWYWLELECQGTTYIAKLYDTGGTVPGVLKSASTLLQTLTATVADAAVAAGGIALQASIASSQWGGIATGNGGMYVETWLPESWSVTFSGTLGGQAIGYDESTDAGPLGKQWAMRAYIPAASRVISIDQGGTAGTAKGQIAPSVTYAGSVYVKISGLGGTGALFTLNHQDYDAAGANGHNITALTDANDAAWTRKTASTASASTGRVLRTLITINVGSTATGTAYFMLPQLEQGTTATVYRNAPADDAPIVWTLTSTLAITTTSGSFVSIDDRDLAANIFLPWDATLAIEGTLTWTNSVTGNSNLVNVQVDAVSLDSIGQVMSDVIAAAAGYQTASFRRNKGFAAGKHRPVLLFARNAGTLTLGGNVCTTAFTITATRGK